MKQYLEKVIEGEDLSLEESYIVVHSIMSGEQNNSQISSMLTALKMKGETPEEVAGFVKGMREKSVKINCEDDNVIDVCGTGGDGSGSFNISTAVCFVAAGAGVKVAKHGNRSISSKSGSSDVLQELGVNVNLTPDKSEKALNEIGVAFLFAPLYHPAMKYVAPVRKELGIRTIFNILGPLSNPASTKKQLIGTFNDRTSELMSSAVDYLEMENVSFVCTNNSFDEISLSHESNVIDFNGGDINRYKLRPADFGYDSIDLDQIKGDSAKENAQIIHEIFSGGGKGPRYKVVAANSALALKVAGVSADLIECLEIAKESIDSGKALEKLNLLISFKG
jgi:anthranilate phosphoribosyltransferase